MKAQSFLVVAAIAACVVFGCIPKNTSESVARPATTAVALHGQTSSNLFIYVGGEVRVPNRYPWTNGMTLADAIAAAGGFTAYAPNTLWISHADGTEEKLNINPKKPLKSNPLVMSGDKIHSPRPPF